MKNFSIVILTVLVSFGFANITEANTGYAIICAGNPHNDQHKTWYWNATSGMYDVLINKYGYKKQNIYFYFSESRSDNRLDGVSTSDNVHTAFTNLSKKIRSNDTLFCYFVGHGSYSGGKSYYEFSDTSVDDSTINGWRIGICSPIQTYCFSQCNSGHFAAALSTPGTIVMTSVRANETNKKAWAEPIRDALNGASGADTNNDGKISMLETFNYAYEKVKNKYKQEDKPLAEHSQIDDNGDKKSTEGTMPSGDEGFTASTRFLSGNPEPWVQGKVSRYNDAQMIVFKNRLPVRYPVIICSAQKNGIPYMACAVNNSGTGFKLAVRDNNGRPGSNVWVQWIAVAPQPWFRAKVVKCKDGDVINFGRNLPRTPVILTNAQSGSIAYCAGAANNSSRGFQLKLADAQGSRGKRAWVQWVAMNLPLAFRGGVKQLNDNRKINFSPSFSFTPVILTSGQIGGIPCIIGAADNRTTGYYLKIRDLSGKSISEAWTQWIALCL